MGAKAILIVEDDSSIAWLIAQLLNMEGYVTETATDGAHALALLGTSHFDLVLTDLNMEPMNGRRFLELKGRDPRLAAIPVIVVSSECEAGEITGAQKVVRKPFHVGELLRAIETTLM